MAVFFLKQPMPVQWNLVELMDRLRQSLLAAEQELRAEQAVYGLDVREERALQSLLAQRMAAYYEVAREVHYPSSAGRKLTHRQRCDVVLTPKGRPLRLDRSPPTLFDPPAVAEPEQALWLEMKVAYQFREGGTPHSGYGGQWRNAIVEDLRKMETESRIRQAALVLIVFNESREVLEKDLELFETILAEKEVLAGLRQACSIGIQDRIGHKLCTVALWPTIQR